MHTQGSTRGYEEQLKLTAGLVVCTLLWVGSLALARYGPSHLWEDQAFASWIAIAANVAIGIGWIFAFARYLRGIDEVQRKIQQDALAMALGIGWVGGLAYIVADAANLVSHDVSVAMFPVLMAVVYMIAVAAGNLRYR